MEQWRWSFEIAVLLKETTERNSSNLSVTKACDCAAAATAETHEIHIPFHCTEFAMLQTSRIQDLHNAQLITNEPYHGTQIHLISVVFRRSI